MMPIEIIAGLAGCVALVVIVILATRSISRTRNMPASRPANNPEVNLHGPGAIIEGAAILEQRRWGRERGGKVVISGREAIEPLINGDYQTGVNHRWMNKRHAGEFEIRSK